MKEEETTSVTKRLYSQRSLRPYSWGRMVLEATALLALITLASFVI
jgi:hypothetical protein